MTASKQPERPTPPPKSSPGNRSSQTPKRSPSKRYPADDEHLR
jgi:hypothetical protein